MRTLEKKLLIKGLGGLVGANQLNRIGDVCLYQRTDSVIFEVFVVQKSKKEVVFGKEYPERELYPSNSDFGLTAWCFKSRERAEDKFEDLVVREAKKIDVKDFEVLAVKG